MPKYISNSTNNENKIYDQSYFKRFESSTMNDVVYSAVKEILRLATLYIKKPISQLRILDIGCGCGEYSIELGKVAKEVIGIEPYENVYIMAKNLEKNKVSNVKFYNLLVENYKTTKRFDIAISLTTLEHMPNHEKSFSQVFNLLKPGGILYLTAPNKSWPYEHHYRLWFLSWLPLSIANQYVKIAGRGNSYLDSAYSLSYWGIKNLFNKFPCSYQFVLPEDINSAYLGCGDKNNFYTIIKKLGYKLISIFPFFWCISKGFIMVIKKNEK